VLEFIYAGASCVQIGTSICMMVWKFFGKIASGLEEFMDEMGYGSLDEIIGIAHK